ncbi:MAG: aminotransferase class I/II-fold pyridoxal phosphate-dependent enzyme, partial [Ignavibacteriales bacterium]|nr:aminotransferase class I/II-fold pyridoxal phosphate-dependent enzyme [Ignavibacteriales bacterium]
YGFAHDRLIGNLLKVKLPFEPSTLAQAAGIGAFKDKEFLHRSLEVNAQGMDYLSQALRELEMNVVPSEANFVMIVRESEDDVSTIYSELLKQGVIVRPLKAFGLSKCLRITVGTDEENKMLIHALKKILVKSLA